MEEGGGEHGWEDVETRRRPSNNDDPDEAADVSALRRRVVQSKREGRARELDLRRTARERSSARQKERRDWTWRAETRGLREPANKWRSGSALER